MDGYHNSETFMSDFNALIYGHQMKMAGLFANRDVVAKHLHEQMSIYFKHILIIFVIKN